MVIEMVFPLKFDVSLLFIRRGENKETLLPLQNILNIDRYVLHLFGDYSAL